MSVTGPLIVGLLSIINFFRRRALGITHYANWVQKCVRTDDNGRRRSSEAEVPVGHSLTSDEDRYGQEKTIANNRNALLLGKNCRHLSVDAFERQRSKVLVSRHDLRMGAMRVLLVHVLLLARRSEGALAAGRDADQCHSGLHRSDRRVSRDRADVGRLRASSEPRQAHRRELRESREDLERAGHTGELRPTLRRARCLSDDRSCALHAVEGVQHLVDRALFQRSRTRVVVLHGAACQCVRHPGSVYLEPRRRQAEVPPTERQGPFRIEKRHDCRIAETREVNDSLDTMLRFLLDVDRSALSSDR